MKKKLNFSILVAVFSFLFFTANAQNEGAIRMPMSELTETYEEQPKITSEASLNNASKEVVEKKAIEKREVIKKVNELKTNNKIVKAKRIKKNLKVEQTSVSQNVKIAIILIAIGAILTIFPVIWYLGVILVVVGLVILLLEIL